MPKAKVNGSQLTTGLVRFSYMNIETPQVNARYGGDPKYNLTFLISKDDTETVEAAKKAIKAAVEYGKVKPKFQFDVAEKNLYIPLRDGDGENEKGEIISEKNPAYKNCYYIAASAYEKYPPAVYGPKPSEPYEKKKVYSGQYGVVAITFKPYAKGIRAQLDALQAVKEGEKLGGRNTAGEFEEYKTEEEESIL